MELTVLLPTLNEAKNIDILIPRIREVLKDVVDEDKYEILVVDANSNDGTKEVVEKNNARLLSIGRGYGKAISEGIKNSRGNYIVTMDADLSHSPYIIPVLYSHRNKADLIIASRNIKDGFNNAGAFRDLLSYILNATFRFLLTLPVMDMSSGFRLYNRRIFDFVKPTKQNYVVLQEILMKTYAEGFKVKEVPFHYHPRKFGSSKARILKFGMEYLRSMIEFWRFRNSMDSADYDERSFNSRILPQRWWQRKRYLIILDYCKDMKKILDIGCGSSQLLEGLPQSVGLDLKMNKLRYKRCPYRTLVQGNAMALPFADASFDVVILSQVIEHLPNDPRVLDEAARVVKIDGYAVIGTPDYSTHWAAIEKIHKFIHPRGYEDKHITHYTKASLISEMEKRGFKCLDFKYISGAEIIMKFQKEE